jgi:DnaK suppressor protein
VIATRIDRFRRRLEVRAKELRAALEKTPDQTPAVVPDVAIGRLTRVEAQQAGYVSEALRRQAAAELASVQRALGRIDAGTYGACPRCDDELSDARLDARPDALLCIACAERG